MGSEAIDRGFWLSAASAVVLSIGAALERDTAAFSIAVVFAGCALVFSMLEPE